jgi:hypothetical protein
MKTLSLTIPSNKPETRKHYFIFLGELRSPIAQQRKLSALP